MSTPEDSIFFQVAAVARFHRHKRGRSFPFAIRSRRAKFPRAHPDPEAEKRRCRPPSRPRDLNHEPRELMNWGLGGGGDRAPRRTGLRSPAAGASSPLEAKASRRASRCPGGLALSGGFSGHFRWASSCQGLALSGDFLGHFGRAITFGGVFRTFSGREPFPTGRQSSLAGGWHSLASSLCPLDSPSPASCPIDGRPRRHLSVRSRKRPPDFSFTLHTGHIMS